jgi:ADP-dependent NAD(P)H-hydrate dehydratase / NAD(P)H-hydrate epimerase
MKGSGSIVAAPERCPWINASGNAGLAAPGTGDVLAGWIGGLWAQQGAGGPEAAWFAARASVWLHGHAADRHAARVPGGGFRPMRAGDLAARMAESMR